jgi:predicted dienelactone hydrolase
LFDVAHVITPIALWGSAFGGDGVQPASVATLAKRLPPPSTDYRVVANAGHFAFLASCSPALAKRVPEICTDPPGFDRVAFHRTFDTEVLAFFRAHLAVTTEQ